MRLLAIVVILLLLSDADANSKQPPRKITPG